MVSGEPGRMLGEPSGVSRRVRAATRPLTPLGSPGFSMLTTDLVEHILATVPGRTVGVLGDLFLDRYLDIDAALNEPSVETGLTAYQVVKVRSYPGAARTVVNNLAALGVVRIYPIAYIGDDGEGHELRQALKRLPAVEHGGII